MVTFVRHWLNTILYRKGIRLLSVHLFDEALSVAKKLHRHRYSGAFEIEGRALQGLNRLEEAALSLERGVREFPNIWILQSYLGDIRSQMGQYDLAIEAFLSTTSTPYTETTHYAYKNIGICYFKMERFHEAQSYFDKVNWELIVPDQHYLRVITPIELGDVTKAEEVFEQISLQLKTEANWSYLYCLGSIALYYGKKDEALSHLKNALSQNDCHPMIIAGFRKLFGIKREYATAFEVLVVGTSNVPELKFNSPSVNYMQIFGVIAERESDILPYINRITEPDSSFSKIEKVFASSQVTDCLDGVIYRNEVRYTWKQ